MVLDTIQWFTTRGYVAGVWADTVEKATSVAAPKLVNRAGAMEGQSMEELLAKVKQDEAEKLQCITVLKELELEFNLGYLLASDQNPTTGLRCA
ncbi:hypothetical protein P7K49_005740 [Saguinus oedipus]|uniref:Uncharacterized protein n=1 Tax=Saguinus oedipus TaxID=9490 RepID=A0ABQ9W0G9_SAGOE|nr:hypothetical protein P7K49_005740 [Saguinus oedipus]